MMLWWNETMYIYWNTGHRHTMFHLYKGSEYRMRSTDSGLIISLIAVNWLLWVIWSLSLMQLGPATTMTASSWRRLLRRRRTTHTESSRPWTGVPRSFPLRTITPSLGGRAPRCPSGAATTTWGWVATHGSSVPSGKMIMSAKSSRSNYVKENQVSSRQIVLEKSFRCLTLNFPFTADTELVIFLHSGDEVFRMQRPN